MDGRAVSPSVEELLAHASWMRELARSLVADYGIADDIVQQTWLAALKRPPATDRSPRPWLARVMRFQLALRRRGAAHRREREAAAARSAVLPSAEEVVSRTEAQRRLIEAVLALAEPYRSAIVLHYYEGLSAVEIARRRGVPSATVRSQIHRGLERLRERLDADFGGDRRTWALALAPLHGLRDELELSSARAAQWLRPSAIAGQLAVVGLIAGAVAWWAQAPHAVVRADEAQASPRGDDALGEVRDAAASEALARAERTAAEPPSTGICIVSVVDASTLEALPDFEVAVLTPDGETQVHTSDDDGTFPLELAATAGEYAFDAYDQHFAAERDTSAHGSLRAIGPPSILHQLTPDSRELVLAARPGPTYLLELERPPQVEIANLRAYLRAKSSRGITGSLGPVQVAPVRAQGAYELPWVRLAVADPSFFGETAPWVLELVSADGFFTGSSEVTSIRGRHEGVVHVTLLPRARLAGRTLDALGPVSADVLLRLWPGDGSDCIRADTDEHGRFAFERLAPGNHRLSVASPRHAPFEIALSLPAGVETLQDVELQLAPIAGEITGRLTSRSGTYAERALLALESTEVRGRRFLQRAQWSEDEGRVVSEFVFDEVPRGRYRLQVFSSLDQLVWLPSPLELEAPASDVQLECQDDVETRSFAFHVQEASSSAPLADFTIVYAVGDGPEITLDHVRPAQSGSGFEWQACFAGFAWALRRGDAQLPRVPLGQTLEWGVFAGRCAPLFGDESAFAEEGELRVARLAAKPGWGARLRVLGQDGDRALPLEGVELSIDGRCLATSRADGALEVQTPEVPKAIELRHPLWRTASELQLSRIAPALRFEVRMVPR